MDLSQKEEKGSRKWGFELRESVDGKILNDFIDVIKFIFLIIHFIVI